MRARADGSGKIKTPDGFADKHRLHIPSSTTEVSAGIVTCQLSPAAFSCAFHNCSPMLDAYWPKDAATALCWEVGAHSSMTGNLSPSMDLQALRGAKREGRVRRMCQNDFSAPVLHVRCTLTEEFGTFHKFPPVVAHAV